MRNPALFSSRLAAHAGAFRQRAFFAAAALAVSPWLFACGAENHAGPAEAAHFSYDAGDAHGPARWGELEGADLCSSGRNQSPVDISGATRAWQPSFQLAYSPAPLVLANKGHTVQVDYASGSSLRLDGKTFYLAQFHFHAPSEHHIQGRGTALEAHLVHKSDTGELAVLGVLIRRGRENAFLKQFWDRIPAKNCGENCTVRDSALEINVRELLPARLDFYRYSGSLTTPPCSEGVRWLVLKDVVEASAEQIDRFNQAIGPSARPVQPLYARNVLDIR